MYKIPASTLFMGKNLIFVPECHSTNDMALQLCQKQMAPEGTLVITAFQTAGRGQRGRTWDTEPGKNLTFSFVVKPTYLSVKDQFYLNIFVSLGISDFITAFTGLKVHIKWPNDIIINDKKICGILVENQLQGTIISNTVVGIGLNINQVRFSVDTATSLSSITGRDYELTAILEPLLKKIEQRYLQLKQNKYTLLFNDYLQNMYWRNENRSFSAHGEKFQGYITGVDDVGRLQIRVEDTIRLFAVKEVQYCL